MKKILFHHNCLEQGGAERVVSNLANQFAKEGYDIIVATEWEGKDEFKLDEAVRRIHVGLTDKDENKNRIAKVLVRLLNLRRLLKQEKPDVAIGFTRKPLYRLLMAAMGVKVPVIIAVRTNPEVGYVSLTDKLCIPFLFRRADGAVFQTVGQRDFFPEFLRKRSILILNHISDKYLKLPENIEKEKLIIHTGRVVDFKDQPMLLRAFLKVHEKHPQYQLLLYGQDSFDGTWEILEGIIKDNKAEEFIHLMGGSDELEKEIPRGEIYVFSSEWEGLPNALIEAMCLGMPVVATDCPCGGPRTVIEDGVNGLLVPIKNEDALAEGMNKLIENPQLAKQMGENARKLVDVINGPAITKQWREYIISVVEEKNR